MKLNEDNAKNGDLFTTADRPYGDDVDDGSDTNGHVIDLIAPVLVLIAACIFGMVYTGGFFEGVDFITAFADCNASAGLVLGSSIALLFTFVFYRVRGVMTFQDFAACIPEGFKAMVSPMLILSLAWTLSGMTGLLGAKYYVANLLGSSAAALQYLLPFIIFLVAVFLAFATGTSWGTFSILIPIVCQAFPDGEMLVVSIAACLSGAVCGDHCSPISDTTIMASAGAHCSHVNHVSTQLPYAITAAACSAVCYIITGLAQAVLGSRASLSPRWCCWWLPSCWNWRCSASSAPAPGKNFRGCCVKIPLCSGAFSWYTSRIARKLKHWRRMTHAGKSFSGRLHQIQAALLSERVPAFCHP